MRTTIIFGLILCLSCVSRREDKDFAELRDRLPQIETPITFNSNVDIKLKPVNLSAENGLIDKLRERNYFSAFGKLFESADIITIIGYIPNDTGTPVLVTFDKNGSQIDSYLVYESAMGDMGHYSSNCVTIFPDKRIQFTDSIVTRKINDAGTDEVPGTDSLTVKIKTYRITDKGTRERVD